MTLGKSRPLLIFKHNPKAGGGTILNIMEEIKPNEILGTDFVKRRYKVPESEYDSSYVRVKEAMEITPEYQKHGFVISNVREPCSQYVSLWGYGSEEHGGFYHEMFEEDPEWTKKAYGEDAPLYSSDSDIGRFRNVWMRDSRVQGVVTNRFIATYLLKPGRELSSHYDYPPSVDCWVYLENFTDNMLSCLKQFERQGGSVNWNTPLLLQLKSLQDKENKRRLQTSKDSIDGSSQAGHHSKCSTYYDDDTSTMVENGIDSVIYNVFGYQGCCKTTRNIVTNYTQAFLNHKHDVTSSTKSTEEKPHSAPSEIPKERHLLIFKDNNVAEGGKSILDILRAMKPNVMSRREYVKNGRIIPEPEENLVYFEENESILTSDQEHGFVISIISEPCSHYASVWQSGSLVKGDIYDYWQRMDEDWTKSAYGQDAPPLFDSKSDIERFRNIWYVKNEGLVASRFKSNYLRSSVIEPPVDCWIYSENYEATLVSCLKKYEEQGGSVDWTNPSMKDFLDLWVEKEKNGAHDDGINLQCEKYFDDEMAVMVENGKESFLYETFDFQGCCNTPRGHKMTNSADSSFLRLVKNQAQQKNINIDEDNVVYQLVQSEHQMTLLLLVVLLFLFCCIRIKK